MDFGQLLFWKIEAQTGSNLIKLARLVQNGSNLFKLDQTCQTWSKWIKFVQTGFIMGGLEIFLAIAGLEIFLAIAGPEIFLAMGEVFFTCLQLRLLAICATWTFGKLDFG